MRVPKLLWVLVAVFSLSSCTAKEVNSDMHPPSGLDNPAPKPMRYLALGDSYTIGESVTSDQRFPVQLQKKLAAEGFDLASPEIIARTGWTTADLAGGIGLTNPKGPYDLITLLIGVNNQYRGLDTAEYRLQFRQLLGLAATFAGNNYARVIVVSIPDYIFTPFGQSRDAAKSGGDIDSFNHINYEETRKTPAEYVDITAISRQGISEPLLVASDGLHPSGEQYRRWVELITPVAKNILGKW